MSVAVSRVLANGLCVAFERRAGPGFAFDIRLPVGSAHDPAGYAGSASITEEWLYKGAGAYSARGLQDALDDLGLRRGGGSGYEATRLAASGLLADLRGALALYADIVQRPHLDVAELPTLLDLARQDLESLQDSPADQLGLLVRARTFAGSGFAHPASGTLAGLQALAQHPEALREGYGRYGAAGSILAVVADLEAQMVFDWAQELFGAWQPGTPPVTDLAVHLGLREHLSLNSQQTQLTLLGQGLSPTSPDWFLWHLALMALSGGSASRLFHAVREERGLAYTVAAGSQLAADKGLLTAYAASTPERAPETLEVVLAELERWKGGLEQGEFERARYALVASTVFGSESVRSRSAGLTRDLILFGRLRAMGEVRSVLEAATLEQVNDFLQRYAYGPLSLFTAGERALDMPQGGVHSVQEVI